MWQRCQMFQASVTDIFVGEHKGFEVREAMQTLQAVICHLPAQAGVGAGENPQQHQCNVVTPMLHWTLAVTQKKDSRLPAISPLVIAHIVGNNHRRRMNRRFDKLVVSLVP